MNDNETTTKDLEQRARAIDGRATATKYSERLHAIWKRDADEYRAHAAVRRASEAP